MVGTLPVDEHTMQYIYGYNDLDRAPGNPTSARVEPRRVLSAPTLETGKSSTIGAVLYGEHIAVALAGQAAGSGAKAHTHPNEQFNYILQGVMVSDIDDEKQTFGKKGTIVHTPSMSVHTGQACPDEDMLFFAMKAPRHHRSACRWQIRWPAISAGLRQAGAFAEKRHGADDGGVRYRSRRRENALCV